MTIATIISTIGSLLTGVIGWFGDVLKFITDNPLALFGILAPVAICLIPKGLSLVKKMLNKRRI